MAGCSPGTRRRAFGERESLKIKNGARGGLEIKDEERESLEIKDGERESLESKRVWSGFGDQQSLETKDGERESGDLARRARVPCAKGSNGTPRERRCHISAAERHTSMPYASRESAGRQHQAGHRREKAHEGQEGQTGAMDLDPVWRVSAGRPQTGNNGSRKKGTNQGLQ
ncbi:uncharacterized protein LOC127012084 [Drosophila biarmipes]|uniref:uncharacterized protein LOC127012084 n=1 Tax=Drosophila biarmipes TaxID=125945 RepID=UPI0021CCECD8|nr:uncharacterized protein LOC127012084 [Drosophila biarmipes]